MRSSVVLLAVLLHAATGWSETEDWSYDEWSEGWQHGAQDVYYAESPADTDVFTAGGASGPATERSTVTGRVNVTGSYSVSGDVRVTGEAWTIGEDEVTRRAGAAREMATTVADKLPTTEGPTFARQPTQIVSAVGHNVTFQCRVHNIGEKEVIWMRSRDLQILSVGASVFSGDSRVSVTQRDAAQLDATQLDATPHDSTQHDVTHNDATQHDATQRDVTQRDRTHNLTIARLRVSDAGKYECQLNTDPKRSLYFNLTVLPVMPQIEMWVRGGGAVREGGAAVLRCAARVRRVTSHGDEASDVTHALNVTLRWYKDGEPVDLQSEGGVSVESSGGAPWRRSVLRVRRVSLRRAGRYECRAAPHAASAHAHLTVLSGWTTEMWAEGMQRDEAAASTAPRRPAPPAPLPRGAAVLVLGALLVALAGRLLLDCTGGIRQLHHPYPTT